MLVVWALLLCVATISGAGSPRRLQSARHFSAPRPPLLTGHAPQTRLPHSHNSATRIGARPSTSSRSLKGSGSARSSPNLLTAASSKKKKKESHLYFLRLKPNKAVPAVSTTTPKPTEAPIFIIKSTPHPGEPPVFIVKTTPSPKAPAPWPTDRRPPLTKPGQRRPTRNKPKPTPPAKPQSVHYHWHQHGPTPIVPQGAHQIKFIVKTKTSSYPQIRPVLPIRPVKPVRPPPQHLVIRPKPQPIKQPLRVHHTHQHQHLHHHLVPATQIIIRKRLQDPPTPPKRHPWSFF